MINQSNFAGLSIINPKRRSQLQTEWAKFFPYYAGYSDSFVHSVLSSIRLASGATVLDPWNGSGTTTYAASRAGFSAIGLDLNPVMIIVARSRMLPSSEADALPPLSAQILRHAVSNTVQCIETDPLLYWFDEISAGWIRSIELSIRNTLLGDLSLTASSTNFNCISSIAATLYVALFNIVKSLTSTFQSSNPTWMRKPKQDQDRITIKFTDIAETFRDHVKCMSEALSKEKGGIVSRIGKVTHKNCDSTMPFYMNDMVDLVLTSPPYCTRIDYTSATRSQLAVIHPLLQCSVEELSRNMVGSIKVPKKSLQIRPEWGEVCVNFLKKVSEHPSHASSSYYLKTHLDYFDKMDRSISNISDSLKNGGNAIMVVQDSYYKEIHNDLPLILSNFAERYGLNLIRRDNFEVKNNISSIRPINGLQKKRPRSIEAVLCFQKQR